MKPVQELTDLELRRELAEIDGWRIVPLQFAAQTAYYHYAVYYGESIECTLEISSPTVPSDNYIWRRAFKEAHIPDCLGDAGIALKLCRGIAAKLDCRLLIDWDYSPPDDPELEVSFVEMWYSDDARGLRIEQEYEARGDTEASALSRLALMALRNLSKNKTPSE